MTFFFVVSMLEVTAGQWWQFISFFAIAPIAFVGVAAPFRDGGLTKKTHMNAAKMSALFSFIWVVLCGIYINRCANHPCFSGTDGVYRAHQGLVG